MNPSCRTLLESIINWSPCSNSNAEKNTIRIYRVQDSDSNIFFLSLVSLKKNPKKTNHGPTYYTLEFVCYDKHKHGCNFGISFVTNYGIAECIKPKHIVGSFFEKKFQNHSKICRKYQSQFANFFLEHRKCAYCAVLNGRKDEKILFESDKIAIIEI